MNRTRPASSLLLALCILLIPTLLAFACSGKGTTTADGKPAGGSDASGGPGAGAGTGGSAPPAGARDPGAVAQVGPQAISYKTFERYLNDNAGEDTEEGTEMDTIKSRLLDQLIEEHLLMAAAANLKIAVSDSEVDAYLKELGLTEGDLDVTAPDGKAAFRERIKNGLVVQKVKEAAVLTKIQVTKGEIDDALKQRPDLTKASSLLVLRQILLDDKKAADEVRRKLETDPGQFEALAKERSVAPDKGQPRSYAEEDLPSDLRDAVTPLQPGQVSPVLEHAQAYIIFQLVRKVEARSSDLAEVRHRVESDLLRQKADQVMERYLGDLKEKTEIHVNRTILPFRYVGEFHD
jgi:peptidyl-prolyl cis-trans isomerase SurA